MRYCKAYLIKDLSQFGGWQDKATPEALEMESDQIAYVLENLKVTTNALEMDKEEDYIYTDITEEWETFCKSTLKFSVPDWEAESKAVRAAIAEAEADS